MMEVVLTRLRDFSCKDTTFDGGKEEGVTRRRVDYLQGERPAGGGGGKLDIAGALAWLRRELMEMRSQDQALVRQLMELHAGIQELKQELSEDETYEVDDEAGSCWDSESDGGSGSIYSGSGDVNFSFPVKKSPSKFYSQSLASKSLSRRSSMP
ncbi:uncharacterized protein si:ch211-153f2.3 [Synchiropus splendidus]|uniref:uncharacterized protein si:ch211-153f2.3 n=1 Tax=Synchiropus splendidus TaxID=270530 RepID=UPI00237DB4E0|nr:uncharacterized protein si:ch211-153f2.3 [Synchiropus splendidus]